MIVYWMSVIVYWISVIVRYHQEIVHLMMCYQVIAWCRLCQVAIVFETVVEGVVWTEVGEKFN